MNPTPAPIVQLDEIEGLARFDHEAMATTFTLLLAPTAQGARRGIAEEAFRLLDQIEDRLSFYREGSDVTRINRAAPGDVVRLHELTHRCLLDALAVAAASGDAFDPFAGAAALRAKHQRVPGHLADLPPPANDDTDPVIAVDPDHPQVTKLAGRRWLDLGAIGKGAALDALADLLREWDVPTAVLIGGGSSVLVLGPPLPPAAAGRWTLRFPALGADARLNLAAPFALGASGEGFQPGHVIARIAADRRPQALVLAPDAALADALSTAALLLSDAALRTLAGDDPGVAILATHATRAPVRLGLFGGQGPAAAPHQTAGQAPHATTVVELSLVIPCWCESARLPPFLTDLAATLTAAALPVELLVVDDGSPAPEPRRTAAVVDAIRARFPLVQPMLTVDHHRGKGGAVYWGWQQATTAARWLALVDADGAVPATDVVRGIQLALSGRTTPRLIAANRYHDEADRVVARGFIRQRSGGWFARWAQKQLRTGAVDSQCGFKIVPAAWWRARAPWQEFGYAFDLELLIAARDDGLPVENFAIAWREVGGSNVTWRDGLRLVQTVRRLRARGPR